MDVAKKTSWAESISKKFLSQNFQRYCGIDVIEQLEGYCLAKIRVNENLENASGRLHAGIFYSVLDVVAFLSAITAVNEGDYPVTHNMNTSLMASAEENEMVFFEASVVRRGKRLVFIDSKAYSIDAEGVRKPLAQASIVKSIIKTNVV